MHVIFILPVSSKQQHHLAVEVIYIIHDAMSNFFVFNFFFDLQVYSLRNYNSVYSGMFER
jgi:hypothetical protein